MNFSSQLQGYAARLSRLEGQYESIMSQRDALELEISLANGRLALHEEMQRAIQTLQYQATERSVGHFQNLLTAIVSDVMPHAGSILLSPTIKNNNPWLDLYLKTENGDLEDIYRNNGGAVSNVVITGGKFIALCRTRNRRFLVLDEPDCWMKKQVEVSRFNHVIREISKATNIQTLYISHNTLAEDAGMNILQFVENESVSMLHPKRQVLEEVTTYKVESTPIYQWESDEQVGIRGIHLKGIRKHLDLYLPLFPGPNFVSGPHNAGKSSATVAALCMVALNDGMDTDIHHHCKKGSVRVDLENRKSIEWNRQPGRNPVVEYRLFEDGVEVLKDKPDRSGNPPAWVADLLGIGLVDGLNFQLSNQKQPVFLIDEDGAKRAKLLSMGKESTHLHALMKKYNSLRSQDLAIVRNGEQQLAMLNSKLQKLAGLHDVVFTHIGLQHEVLQLEANLTIAERNQLFISQYKTLREKEATFSLYADSLVPVSTPTLHDSTAHRQWRNGYYTHHKIVTTLSHDRMASINVPQLGDTQHYVNWLQQTQRVRNTLQLTAKIATVPTIVVPELDSTAEHRKVSPQLRHAHAALLLIPEDLKPLSVPTLNEVTGGYRIASGLRKARQVMSFDDKLKMVTMPVVTVQADWAAQLKSATRIHQENNAQLLVEETALLCAHQQEKQLKDLIGICPLCQSNLRHDHGEQVI